VNTSPSSTYVRMAVMLPFCATAPAVMVTGEFTVPPEAGWQLAH